MTVPDRLEPLLAPDGLTVLGGFHPMPTDDLGAIRTLLMVGPGATFWQVFAASDEYADGQPDPLDRWTRRVLGRIAHGLDAISLFPFGGPPFHPFLSWARRTGRAWPSPVGLTVHAEQGLWLSYRGALGLYDEVPVPEAMPCPCDTCADRPCLTACPVDALSAESYDVDRCQAHVTAPEGVACRTAGCRVRAACPVGDDIPNARAAFHMEAFLR
ncbi:ferredoxin [Tranquillimonas rosea]|uniref:ferredoxin n=1 Tax=Tranquillimonas rosea TaxID=641238 RepID=UPI003BAB5C5C